jgi:protein-S-isoprenylcysteine O-methyltransferase Ste14
MYFFLIPLIIGFVSNLASAFTTTYSEKWGKQTGSFVTIILRDILGIPVWAIGFVLAIKESSGVLYQSTFLTQITGWLIITAGAIIIIVALISIRVKAAAPSTGDSLVKSGVYSFVRHPIHCGTFFEFAGLLILWPSSEVGIAVLLGIIWILLQSRFEEKDLIRRIPDYKKYMEDVPRFFPKIR